MRAGARFRKCSRAGLSKPRRAGDGNLSTPELMSEFIGHELIDEMRALKSQVHFIGHTNSYKNSYMKSYMYMDRDTDELIHESIIFLHGVCEFI